MLYIYRGLPGSGKSTAASKIGCLHLEADMYFIRNGVYQYNKDYISEAHNWCSRACSNALWLGIDVVVANVFATNKLVDIYVQKAIEEGHDYKVVFFHKNFGSIHNVPKEAIDRFSNQWECYPGEERFAYK